MRTYVNCESKFIIKPEEGIVICVMKCQVDLFNHPSYDCMDYAAHTKRLPNVKGTGKFTVTGISKCHKDDTFNEEKGKRIAESKAKFKAFNIARKVYLEHAKAIDKALYNVLESAKNCSYCVTKEQEHLQLLTSE